MMDVNLKDYEALALDLLREELTPAVEKVTVRADEDWDGVPSLFFEAWLDENAVPDLGARFVLSHLHLNRALEQLGETRFPYMVTRRPTDGGKPREVILKSDRGSRAKRRAAS